MNALSGKIMFRDVVYMTEDSTIRIQDGYLIFRWWRAYVPKDVSEGIKYNFYVLDMLASSKLHLFCYSKRLKNSYLYV